MIFCDNRDQSFLLVSFFFYFPQEKPYFTDLARRMDQSQRELSESWPTTFQTSTKHLLWCSLSRSIITCTKTGGMLSCTLETKTPAMISTMICIITQTPSRQMVGKRDPSVLVWNFGALCPTLGKLPWRFKSWENEQQACKPSMLPHHLPP